MDIDKRIEALTQSVEILTSFHRDTEAAMRDLDEKLTAKIAENADNIAQISRLVLFHEQRLKDLKR